MKILELFSGTKSFSKTAEARGHEVFTVDIEKEFNPDLCKNIMDLKIEDIPFKPDFIWASPPCTSFSVASLRIYWIDGKPKINKTIDGMLIAFKTLALIKALDPKYWVLENPRGMLRKQWFMQSFKRNTVTYCQYGLNYMKPTELWNNLPTWKPRKMCKRGMPCHEKSERGEKKQGLQGLPGWNKKDRILRSAIPKELCEEILDCLEILTKSEIQQEGETQKTLG